MISHIDRTNRTNTMLALHPLRALVTMIGIARGRRDLARLDDHLLRDIGLSRGEAETEAACAFWDAPAHWYQGRGAHD